MRSVSGGAARNHRDGLATRCERLLVPISRGMLQDLADYVLRAFPIPGRSKQWAPCDTLQRFYTMLPPV